MSYTWQKAVVIREDAGRGKTAIQLFGSGEVVLVDVKRTPYRVCDSGYGIRDYWLPAKGGKKDG